VNEGRGSEDVPGISRSLDARAPFRLFQAARGGLPVGSATAIIPPPFRKGIGTVVFSREYRPHSTTNYEILMRRGLMT
jgi:hypothetical protein